METPTGSANWSTAACGLGEGHVSVHRRFAGKSEDPFADDVLLYLVGAAGNPSRQRADDLAAPPVALGVPGSPGHARRALDADRQGTRHLGDPPAGELADRTARTRRLSGLE